MPLRLGRLNWDGRRWPSINNTFADSWSQVQWIELHNPAESAPDPDLPEIYMAGFLDSDNLGVNVLSSSGQRW